MEQVRLDGERVYLRSITYDDTDIMVEWRNQENVKKYFFYNGPFTKEIHENWMRNKVETGEVAQFIICLKEDDKPIGSTFLRDIDYKNNKAQYGIFIGTEDIRGMGIGKESLRLTIQYAFEELKMHRVYSLVKESNKPSIYHLLNSGFEIEAVLRDSEYCDGEYANVVIASILNK